MRQKQQCLREGVQFSPPVILHLALGLIIRGPVFGSTPAMAEEEEEEEERENTDG